MSADEEFAQDGQFDDAERRARRAAQEAAWAAGLVQDGRQQFSQRHSSNMAPRRVFMYYVLKLLKCFLGSLRKFLGHLRNSYEFLGNTMNSYKLLGIRRKSSEFLRKIVG